MWSSLDAQVPSVVAFGDRQVQFSFSDWSAAMLPKFFSNLSNRSLDIGSDQMGYCCSLHALMSLGCPILLLVQNHSFFRLRTHKCCSFGETLTLSSSCRSLALIKLVQIFPLANFLLLLTPKLWGRSVYLLPHISHVPWCSDNQC